MSDLINRNTWDCLGNDEQYKEFTDVEAMLGKCLERERLMKKAMNDLLLPTKGIVPESAEPFYKSHLGSF